MLLLLLFITAVFLAMIQPFLMTVLMAAIFSGLAWQTLDPTTAGRAGGVFGLARNHSAL
ncbi:MAG: hypothetical protein MUC46_03525 [Desulfobacterales bacterium]|nr:hypothetical protein [Desulfobacterales bacterium]